jgi:hypothetical protein
LTTTNKGGNDTMLTPHSTSSMGYMNKTGVLNLPARIASREESNRPKNGSPSKNSNSRPKSAKRPISKTSKRNNNVPVLHLTK